MKPSDKAVQKIGSAAVWTDNVMYAQALWKGGGRWLIAAIFLLGCGAGIAGAALFRGVSGQNYDDCLANASQAPTDTGVRLAIEVCRTRNAPKLAPYSGPVNKEATDQQSSYFGNYFDQFDPNPKEQ
ncbi:MAG: hypothetical protein EPN60_16995 [Nevskiaceae bacterium]|nr:MAG: hypothetical protein EPN60_16995 [Nevskiaceae bacterium]